MECNTRSMGQGKQTILIIKYGTTLNEFLLYSTVRYAIKEDVLDFFREKSLLKTNLLQTRDDGYEVKYYETKLGIGLIGLRNDFYEFYFLWR